MQLPGTQIQATKRVFCLALAPSSRLRCLLKQPRWPFRLEYHKTAPSWVQPCIPLSRLARSLTKQTKIRLRRKEAHTALRRLAEAVGTWRTRGGYCCGRVGASGGGGGGGGAPYGYHAAAALHTTKSVQSRVSCTEMPLRRHMQPLQETLAGTRLVYLLSYRCTPPPSAWDSTSASTSTLQTKVLYGTKKKVYQKLYAHTSA